MKSTEFSTGRLKEELARIPNYRVSASHLPYESGPWTVTCFLSPSSTNPAKLIDRESWRWELMLILIFMMYFGSEWMVWWASCAVTKTTQFISHFEIVYGLGRIHAQFKSIASALQWMLHAIHSFKTWNQKAGAYCRDHVKYKNFHTLKTSPLSPHMNSSRNLHDHYCTESFCSSVMRHSNFFLDVSYFLSLTILRSTKRSCDLTNDLAIWAHPLKLSIKLFTASIIFPCFCRAPSSLSRVYPKQVMAAESRRRTKATSVIQGAKMNHRVM